MDITWPIIAIFVIVIFTMKSWPKIQEMCTAKDKTEGKESSPEKGSKTKPPSVSWAKTTVIAAIVAMVVGIIILVPKACSRRVSEKSSSQRSLTDIVTFTLDEGESRLVDMPYPPRGSKLIWQGRGLVLLSVEGFLDAHKVNLEDKGKDLLNEHPEDDDGDGVIIVNVSSLDQEEVKVKIGWRPKSH